MSGPIFADDVVRKAIRENFTSDYFVEAGAGTGKTTALVSRIVGLICSGTTTIDQIVAITFTEAAAAELRSRLRHELGIKAIATDDTISAANSSRALEAFGALRAMTIHAWARSLIETHSEALGLPSSITVINDAENSQRLARMWRKRLRVLSNDDDAHHHILLLRLLGVRATHWESVVELLNTGLHQMTNASAVSVVTPLDWEGILTTAQSALPFLSQCIVESDPLATFVRLDWSEWLQTASEITNELSRWQQILDVPRVRRGAGSKQRWDPQALASTRTALDQTYAMVDVAAAQLCEAELRWLLDQAYGVVQQARDARHLDGAMSFDDLLSLADELTQHSELLDKIAAEVSYVFIDELQDTDPVQMRFISRIVSAIQTDGAGFFVGDPKQSIYRFRGADLDVYRALRAQYNASAVALNENYRSRDAILRWVNRSFVPLFNDEWTPETELRSVRESELGSIVVVDECIDKENIDTVRDIEAEHLCVWIAEQVGTLSVTDANGAERVSRLDDFAILLPTRAALPALEAALGEAAMAYRIESQTLLWDTQEIRDIAAIARAVMDPSDEVALIAALRSLYFACSDDELLGYRQAGGEWDYLSESLERAISPRVIDALEKLRSLHHDAQWWTPGELVTNIIHHVHAFELAEATLHSEEHQNRLRFLMHAAQQKAYTMSNSLAFLDWVDSQRDSGERDIDYAQNESTLDAVRILTIHAAKGLEFPVVLLAGLQSPTPPPGSTRLLWHEDTPQLRIGPKTARVETTGFLAASEIEDQAQAAERIRLLYVGATRARDHLYVSLIRKNNVRCLAATVAESFQSA